MRKNWKTRIGKAFAVTMTAALALTATFVPAAAEETDAGEVIEDFGDLADLEAEIGGFTADITLSGSAEAGPLGDLGIELNAQIVTDPASGSQSATGKVGMSGISYEFSGYMDKEGIIVKIPGLPKALSFSFAGIPEDSMIAQMVDSKTLSAINNILALLRAELTDQEAMEKYAEELMGVIMEAAGQLSFEPAEAKDCMVGGEMVSCEGMQAVITRDLALQTVKNFLNVTLPNGQTFKEYIEMLTGLESEEAVDVEGEVESFFADMPDLTFAMYMNDDFPVELSLGAEGTVIALQLRGPADAPWSEIAFNVAGEDMAVVNVDITETGLALKLSASGSEVATLDINAAEGTWVLDIAGVGQVTGTFGMEDGAVVFTASYEGLTFTARITEGGTVVKPEGEALEITTMTEEDFSQIAEALSSAFGGSSADAAA